MNYKGVIIEESLIDLKILEELDVIETKISTVTPKEETSWLSKWTLKTVIIKEKEIEKYAGMLSKLIDTKHSSNWYCDFRNDLFHYVVFSNKVFKLDRSKKEDYDEMRKYALSIGIPVHQLPNFNDLPISLLTGFLIEAKKQTYANSNAPKIVSSRMGSKDYQYEETIEGEPMIYHDTYFGGLKFIGEEIVYRSNIPKWGMNYYGVTLDLTLCEEAIDKALRPALMMVGDDSTVIPVRGPSSFSGGEFIYTFKSEGTLESFTGIEEIYKGKTLVYLLHCHGGIIE